MHHKSASRTCRELKMTGLSGGCSCNMAANCSGVRILNALLPSGHCRPRLIDPAGIGLPSRSTVALGATPRIRAGTKARHVWLHTASRVESKNPAGLAFVGQCFLGLAASWTGTYFVSRNGAPSILLLLWRACRDPGNLLLETKGLLKRARQEPWLRRLVQMSLHEADYGAGLKASVLPNYLECSFRPKCCSYKHSVSRCRS